MNGSAWYDYWGKDDTTEWRLDLPRDPDLAAALLRDRQQTIEDIEQRMEQGECQLAALDALTSGLSFAQSEPIDRLCGHLRQLRNPASLSFEVVEEPSGWREWVASLTRTVGLSLKVQTDIEGKAAAISWWRHCLWQTNWIAREPHVGAQHGKVLDMTLQLRRNRFRLASRIFSTGTHLAIRLSLPGGALTALPYIWCFFGELGSSSKQEEKPGNNEPPGLQWR